MTGLHVTDHRGVTRCYPLSPLQGAVLAYVRGCIADCGQAPTLDEIAHALGLSRTAVHAKVWSLARRGLIARDKWHPRSIRITQEHAPAAVGDGGHLHPSGADDVGGGRVCSTEDAA